MSKNHVVTKFPPSKRRVESPYKRASDSPSRQLLWELGRLQVTDQEAFYARLEKDNQEREATHRAALAAAVAEHDRVRRSAEIEREKLELRIEKERKRRENEQQRELDRQRQEKVEQEIAEKRRAFEAAKAAEAKEKEIAEARKIEAALAEKARLQKERQDAENAKKLADKLEARRDAEEAARKEQQAIIVTEKPSNEQRPESAPSQPAVHGTWPTQRSQKDDEHRKYLDIHKRLKDLRRFVATQTSGSANANLKKKVGDMRRSIRKCVGQLTEGKGANRAPLQEIINHLKEAATITEPQVDITMFLASPIPTHNESKGPALLVYQLNVFAKAIVSQFIDEAGVAPKSADPVGTIASHIFAINEFRWKGITLIDILIAKLHVVCPVLWGIYGNEKTTAGKTRLGWWRENKGGPWISEQRHAERMTGLGAGFAAIALRNYEKARLENPYPHYHYWQAMAAIINVQPQEATQTHFIVLKAMIENNETRFLEFFGDAGIVALRKALVDFPRQAVDNSVAAKAVAVLPDVLKRDKKLFL